MKYTQVYTVMFVTGEYENLDISVACVTFDSSLAEKIAKGCNQVLKDAGVLDGVDDLPDLNLIKYWKAHKVPLFGDKTFNLTYSGGSFYVASETIPLVEEHD